MTYRLLAFILALVVLQSSNVCAFSLSRPVCGHQIRIRHEERTVDTQLHSSRVPTFLYMSDSSSDTAQTVKKENGFRSKIGKITGFSWTAFRATLRAATGISLSAVYASSVAASGAWIRQTMKSLLSIFPAWARYFVQPFLILYYTPLFIIRNLAGSTRKTALAKRALLIEGWKEAVDEANVKTSSWPVESSDVGYFKMKSDVVDISDALADSVELKMGESKAS